jgi:hypothetical protein
MKVESDVNDRNRLARRLAGFAVLAVSAVLWTAPASAQGGRRGPNGPAQGAVSPVELQRLFDAYVVMQAQQELQLTDQQYPQFLARVKVLQDARRRAAERRGRILGELRRLLAARDGQADEGQIRAQLKALDEAETGGMAEVRQALDGLNQVLDVRQQARFRLFEEQMERRKVELMMRARQANRPRNQF